MNHRITWGIITIRDPHGPKEKAKNGKEGEGGITKLPKDLTEPYILSSEGTC